MDNFRERMKLIPDRSTTPPRCNQSTQQHVVDLLESAIVSADLVAAVNHSDSVLHFALGLGPFLW
jgi:hypothetical protein